MHQFPQPDKAEMRTGLLSTEQHDLDEDIEYGAKLSVDYDLHSSEVNEQSRDFGDLENSRRKDGASEQRLLDGPNSFLEGESLSIPMPFAVESLCEDGEESEQQETAPSVSTVSKPSSKMFSVYSLTLSG
jgi:hypothetical protein